MKNLAILTMGLVVLCANSAFAQTCQDTVYYGTTRDYKFTARNATGLPANATGLVIKAYKANDTTTEITTGITITGGPFDSMAGLYNVRVNYAADGTFYAPSNDVAFIVTTGATDTSIIGEVVCNVHVLPAPSVADIPNVNVTSIAGTAQTAVNILPALAALANKSGSVSPFGGTYDPSTDSLEAATDNAVVLSAQGATNFSGFYDNGSTATTATVGQILAILQAARIKTGTATAGAARTITLDSSAVATANYYVGAHITIISSTGLEQTRTITGYTAARVATVNTNWATPPGAGSVYVITP